MILRVIYGGALGAVVLMAFGYLYWALLLPPGTAIREVRDQPRLADALRSLLPAAGTYFIPHASASRQQSQGPRDGDHRPPPELRGAVAMVHFNPQGGNPLSAQTYFLSFAHFVLSAGLAALLLAVALPALATYRRRAGFVFGLALFATFAVRLTDPIWYRLPWAYFLYSSLYLLVGWALAALVIAAVVRPTK
ncbi:MAG: hypothetical protein O7A08_00965 [SAR324 cluster bacterium]|nr:hypothetical protein [SAR324 cluster bacterium]